jgi:hypothetical protein
MSLVGYLVVYFVADHTCHFSPQWRKDAEKYIVVKDVPHKRAKKD